MRHIGKIVSWKDEAGFGFVAMESSNRNIFVHIKAFSDYSRRPTENDQIAYDLAQDKEGRFYAKNIQFVCDEKKRFLKRTTTPIIYYIYMLFLMSLCGLVCFILLSKLRSTLIPSLYLITNLISYIAYAKDKRAAQNGRWRTRESTLHFFDLIGGWIGGLWAQQILRHKSRKISFQIFFWITVILNCYSLLYLCTEEGYQFAQKATVLVGSYLAKISPYATEIISYIMY